MRKLFSILALLGLPVLALAQTATPSTTFCGAVKATDTSVCLTSTTNVHNQTGLYSDGEYMTVVLAQGQTVASSNGYVPVTRGNRFAGSGPSAHANSAVVWEALTPADSVVPGDNGFEQGMPSTFSFTGPCTRGNYAYLPRIIPDRGVMRDCPLVNGATTGIWTDWNPTGNTIPVQNTFQALTTNGALPVTSGIYVITKAGVLADTLAAPTAGVQDGTIIRIVSSTANAHTLTATGLFQSGTSSVNLATFAAQAGAGLTLMAYNGKWIVLYSVGITFS